MIVLMYFYRLHPLEAQEDCLTSILNSVGRSKRALPVKTIKYVATRSTNNCHLMTFAADRYLSNQFR